MTINVRWKQFKNILLHGPTRSQLAKLGLVMAPFAIALITSFWDLSSLGLSHWDEYYFIATAARMGSSSGWGHLYPYDPPLFSLFLFAMFRRFGFLDYVAVATSSIMAFVVCIGTFVWVHREYDLRTAVVSTSVLASTELFAFYARMALSDMTFTLFFSLAVFAYFHAIKSQKGSAYLLAGVVLTLAIAAKYNGFQPLIIAAIFALYFHFTLVSRPGPRLRRRIAQALRGFLHSLSGLWLSTIPAIVFTVLFLAFLGKPFQINDFNAIRGILRDILPKVSEGLAYFIRIVYPTKAAVLRPQPFVSLNFYSNALTRFIAAPVLLLGAIGAVKGIVRKNLADILLLLWAGYVFVYFASTPATYVRTMLPAVVPIAILSGSGLVWALSAIDRFLRTQELPTLRKREYRTLVKVTIVMAVLAVNFALVAPAISDSHSAYRRTAEFITKAVPDGQMVWLKAQPVLIAYLGMMGKHVRIADNITQIGEAYVIVLDFIAESYPEWPQIEAKISQMQLVYSIRNDVPVVNVLDWTNFSRLSGILSDPVRMSIRVYSRAGQISNYQSEASSAFPQINDIPATDMPVVQSYLDDWLRVSDYKFAASSFGR